MQPAGREAVPAHGRTKEGMDESAAATRLAHGSCVTYATVEAPLGEVRVSGRTRAIRRAGLAAAAVLVCTLAAQLGQTHRQAAVLAGGAVPSLAGALKAVGGELTPGERKLFGNDARRLAAEEALHAKLDRERAAHLLKMITTTAKHNAQNAAMEARWSSLAEHRREALADKKQARNLAAKGASLGQQAFQTVDVVTQQPAREGPPKKGLTKELDQSFSQQLAARYAEHAESRAQRESRFLHERQEAEMARKRREHTVDDARARYHEARAAVVKAKDALKDALAERDQETEKVRGEAFVTQKQAAEQLLPFDAKVKSLLHQVVTTKKEWETAHAALENAEAAGTRPELSFPAPFTANSAHTKQQLAASRQAHQPAVAAVHAAAVASSHQVEPMSTAASTASSVSASATSAKALEGHVSAARKRLAVKKAGLIGGLKEKELKKETVVGPRTYDGADTVVAAPAAGVGGMTGMFGMKAPVQALAVKHD